MYPLYSIRGYKCLQNLSYCRGAYRGAKRPMVNAAWTHGGLWQRIQVSRFLLQER